MQEKTNPNDPIIVTEFQGGKLGIGLTKREYFAAMAMQGMLAANYGDFNNHHTEYISKLSVEQSDALIKELNK